ASDSTHSGVTANTSPTITVTAGTFAKLQLLAPGETASPGSSTGKTGTPTARTAGTAFNVTVNAVDTNWNLLTNATDTVRITGTDTNAALPSDTAVAGGTQTLNVTFNTVGAWTLTVSDVTNVSKTANTSPSITVTPAPFAKLQ